jgi:hypothetical protein
MKKPGTAKVAVPGLCAEAFRGLRGRADWARRLIYTACFDLARCRGFTHCVRPARRAGPVRRPLPRGESGVMPKGSSLCRHSRGSDAKEKSRSYRNFGRGLTPAPTLRECRAGHQEPRVFKDTQRISLRRRGPMIPLLVAQGDPRRIVKPPIVYHMKRGCGVRRF